MSPKQIKIFEKNKLHIVWDDGNESKIDLKYLRDECPCASCKGETVLMKTYRPVKPAGTSPEMYKIKNIETVGGYAIQVTWKDGHNTGIFTWDYLKQLDADQSDSTQHNYNDLI